MLLNFIFTRLFLFLICDLQIPFIISRDNDHTMVLSMMWIVPGIILLGAMLFGGIHLWIKRRRESKNPDLYGYRIRPDFYDDEK